MSSKNSQRELETELVARINHDSPTKYDIDFYKRKINRLETDFGALQDDLNKARVRLRRAQDFQLKYEHILKQNSNVLADIDQKEKQVHQLKSQIEHLKRLQEQKGGKGEDFSKERGDLQKEIEKWKLKAEDSEEKRISFILQNKEKSEMGQRRQLENFKKEFSEKEESYQFQIRQLKKTIHEKENIQNIIGSRVQKVRTEKDQEIKRLQLFIEKMRNTNNEALKEKNDQLDKFKDKFEKIFNFELENFKKNLEDQDELFHIELNGFREMLSMKNYEVQKLLESLKRQSESHQKQRDEMNGQINMLREKIYSIERCNELQIYNIKERLTKLHASDIEVIEKRYTQIVEGLKQDRKELEKQLKEKDKIVEAQKREYERMKNDYIDRLKEREARIQHLQERIKESAEMNDNEIKNLHQSFHQIESEKEIMTNEYQTNVGFLNQQYSKLTVKNQSLNLTIKGLHQQIIKIKKQYADLIQDIEARWKQERRQYDEEKSHERQRYEKLQDEGRQKERQYKMKEKNLERAVEREERQKVKLQFIIEEMQRDTQRLNSYIKQLDENLKRELKKNQMSTLDTGGIRRELNAELERQKSQLQAIKRMEVDQLRKKMQIELVRLINENEKIQTELVNRSVAYQNLQEQFNKLDHINRNIEKMNKQKLIEYQKKMATLNNEINLTQHLYQNFLENKAKKR